MEHLQPFPVLLLPTLAVVAVGGMLMAEQMRQRRVGLEVVVRVVAPEV